MKASYRWLRELVPNLTASPEELAARLIGGGLEVEGKARFGEGAAACVVAEVVSMRPHPQRAQLRLVTVKRGTAEPLEVICGAPNVPDPGGLVVLAPLGARLPAPGGGMMTIERRAIGGVTSEGMLCSEAELGLSDDAEGILVLAPGTGKPGDPFTKAVPSAEDVIYEIALTANRPDGLGHVGLAREIAALFELPWEMPKIDRVARTAEIGVDTLAKVAIEDLERCPHYGASGVVDVTIGPSPLWVRHRLASLGVRPISNVVDVTNLVMLEYGHPMHAFDLERVRGGKIVVRRAKDGETMTTLDGVERKLTTDDLLICDAEGPVALAGVMGGANSEIQAGTKRVLFECAYFEPRGVRRASRRHGLHTESSHRFERGVDPGDVSAVLARASSLTTRLAGGAAARGEIHAGDPKPTRAKITLRSSRLDQLLGGPVPFVEARAILGRLGCTVTTELPGEITVDAPTHRPDLGREVDLIEEVVRVRGIDRIAPVLPAIKPTRDEGPREELARRVRAAAVEQGLSEAITYAFVSPHELDTVGAPKATVVLENPLGEQQSVMRTSLLPGLFEALGRARRHGERDVRMFTVGATYLAGGAEGLPDERMSFAAVLAGERPSYLAKPEPADVWDGKGLADGIVSRLARRPASVRALAATDRPKHLHPRGAAAIFAGDTRVGALGPLHPDVADALDIGGECVVLEIDVGALAALGRVEAKYQAIPRFPAATRDLAVVVHDAVPAGDVEAAVRDAAGRLAEEVRLFDRFVGGSIPAEHASLAFHVVYRAADRTLTDAEVDGQHAKVVAEVGKRFGAQLRA
jgi:phenylalanyl-tRNA synthetase beta chain